MQLLTGELVAITAPAISMKAKDALYEKSAAPWKCAAQVLHAHAERRERRPPPVATYPTALPHLLKAPQWHSEPVLLAASTKTAHTWGQRIHT